MKISELIGHLTEFQASHGDLRVILTWEGTAHDVPPPDKKDRHGNGGIAVDDLDGERVLWIDAEQ